MSNGCCAFRRCGTLARTGRASGRNGLVCLCAAGTGSRCDCVRTTGSGTCDILVVSNRLSIRTVDRVRRGFRGAHFIHISDSAVSGLVHGSGIGGMALGRSRGGTLRRVFGDRLPGVRGASFVIAFRTLKRGSGPIVLARDRCVHHVHRVSTVRPNVSFCKRLPSGCGLILGASRRLIGGVLDRRRTTYTRGLGPVLSSLGN